jgi:hypothetical protein
VRAYLDDAKTCPAFSDCTDHRILPGFTDVQASQMSMLQIRTTSGIPGCKNPSLAPLTSGTSSTNTFRCAAPSKIGCYLRRWPIRNGGPARAGKRSVPRAYRYQRRRKLLNLNSAMANLAHHVCFPPDFLPVQPVKARIIHRLKLVKTYVPPLSISTWPSFELRPTT